MDTLLVVFGVLAIAFALITVFINRGSAAALTAGVVLVLVGVVFFAISASLVVVEPGTQAVIFDSFTGALKPPLSAGTHFITPIAQTATIYDVSKQTINFTASQNNSGIDAKTNDGQVIIIDVTAIFSLDTSAAGDIYALNEIHRQWGSSERLSEGYVAPVIRSLVRDSVANQTASQIYGGGREELREAISVALAAEFEDDGVTLDNFLIRSIIFDEAYEASVAAAQRAEQDLRRQETESEQLRVRSAGERDAAIALAEGEAQAIIIRASAEAQALNEINAAIGSNPYVIQYLFAQNLSDNIQLALVPDGGSIMFNLPQEMLAVPPVTAPEVVPSETPAAAPAQ